MARFNPFRPGKAIHPGMFVGRLHEVHRIEHQLVQARGGNPGHFMITGERGIGKSSLLAFAEAIAEGAVSLDGSPLKFLVITTDIEPSTTRLSLMQKVANGLQREIEEDDKLSKAVRKAWETLQRLEVAGTSLRSKDDRALDDAAIENATHALAETVKGLTEDHGSTHKRYDGVLLLIDEADNASDELGLGLFLKLFCERLDRGHCCHFLLGIAGLPRLHDALLRSHESSLRLFEELDLGPLDEKQVGHLIELGLKEADAKNGRQTAMDEEAKQLLIRLSEGLPHFVQQFCFSAFAHDSDWRIGKEDVLESAYGSGGALELIGQRYYRDAYFGKIKSQSYREILRIMAEIGTTWVSKEQIRLRFSGTATTLTNAIHALTEKNIIISKEDEKGVYKLVTRGFGMWIMHHAQGQEVARTEER